MIHGFLSFLFFLLPLHYFHDGLALVFSQMTQIGHRNGVIHGGLGGMTRFPNSLKGRIFLLKSFDLSEGVNKADYKFSQMSLSAKIVILEINRDKPSGRTVIK